MIREKPGTDLGTKEFREVFGGKFCMVEREMIFYMSVPLGEIYFALTLPHMLNILVSFGRCKFQGNLENFFQAY